MAKIIKLDTARRPAGGRKQGMAGCEHKNVIAYTASRTVHCSACGVELDPFDVLVDLLKGYPPTDPDREERRFDSEERHRRQDCPGDDEGDES